MQVVDTAGQVRGRGGGGRGGEGEGGEGRGREGRGGGGRGEEGLKKEKYHCSVLISLPFPNPALLG